MKHKVTFEQDGFVRVPGFCDAEELQTIETALARFIAERVPALPVKDVFYEDKSDACSLKQIQRMHEHDDFFAQLIEGKPKQLAEELLSGQVVCKNLQYFNKPPALSQATPPHQDGYYFMLEPCRAVTMWMALDMVDEENGCVRYVRGSHMRGLRPHVRTDTLGFSQGINDYGSEYDCENETACPAQPGDLLAHHALTIHRADANQSTTRSRRALGFIFYGESTREDAEAHDIYQKHLAWEMAKVGKI